MKKALFLMVLFSFLLSFSLVSAVNTYKIDTNVSINHPVRNDGQPIPTADCSISVINPDTETIVNYATMTNGTAFHNYTIADSLNDRVGLYDYYITCSGAGLNKTSSFQYQITWTGDENPSGTFKVTFSLIFIAICASLLFFFLHAVAKGGKFEFDIKDLAWSWGFLFTLLATYLVFQNYWNDAVIGNFLLWIIGVASVTNGFLPVIMLVVSIMFGTIKTKRPYNVLGSWGK